MIAQSKEIRIRLLLGIGLVVVLASVYVRALAVASVYGTFSGMVRPWQDVGTDLLLFSLSAVSLGCVAPAVRAGPRLHRVVGLVLASLPLLVLGHFVTWLIGVQRTPRFWFCFMLDAFGAAPLTRSLTTDA